MEHTQTGGQSAGLGSVLAGRYRLVQCVGRGGMADVYRAQDELLDRTVAVKLFRLDAAVTNEQLRIDAEMRTLAGLRHRGLVTLYDASATGDETSGHAPYLVMELIDGPTLRHRLGSGPLPPSDVAIIAADVAGALRYVHANGLVHRDVKPANILLDVHDDGTATPSAKLTDFGIARFTDGARITEQGMTVGTANYLSPEQALGQPVGPSSDIYSLGLVLIECLTGQVAYPGSGAEAAIARLNNAPHVPTEFGSQWFDLLTAMTDRDPQARPDTARVGAALTALAARADQVTAQLGALPPSAGPPTGATTVLPTNRRPSSRKRLGYLGAAALAAAVLVIVLVASLTSSDGGTAPGQAVAYPTVAGPLGAHLDSLEGTLTGDGAAMNQLRADAHVLATAAATKHYATAKAALSTLQLDAAAARAAGQLDDVTLAKIRTAIAPLPGDLAAATASAPTSATPVAPSSSTKATVVHVPVPPKKPGKGKGHGGHGGGGD
jgi:tRNA A-37 threonylcarbamoyl transferase component Bud32